METEPADPNEKFRIVPSNFAHVDFSNRSYGLYRTLSKVNISLNLINGDYDYSDGDGGQWFRLSDVYFTDVTGDGRFVKRETEVFFAPVRDVKNYQAQINIID